MLQKLGKRNIISFQSLLALPITASRGRSIRCDPTISGWRSPTIMPPTIISTSPARSNSKSWSSKPSIMETQSSRSPHPSALVHVVGVQLADWRCPDYQRTTFTDFQLDFETPVQNCINCFCVAQKQFKGVQSGPKSAAIDELGAQLPFKYDDFVCERWLRYAFFFCGTNESPVVIDGLKVA